MKQKLFSIFIALAMLLPMSVQAGSWSWSWSDFDHGTDAALLGYDGDNAVYKYEWWTNKSSKPCTRLVVCFLTANGVTYNGDIFPPKGDYPITQTEAAGNVARYNTANDYWWVYNSSRWFSMVYNASNTQYKFYSGTVHFKEGADGPYIYCDNLVLANKDFTSTYSGTNSIYIGTDATYYSVNVVSNNNSYGTVTSTYKSGYVYANNRSQEYKKNSVYTITATPKSGYRFVSWSDGGAQTHDITITGNQTYTATFESLAGQQYTVTTAVNNNSLGSVTPIGYQYENTNWDVAVTINDPANYYLSDWLRDGVSMGVRTNPLPVTVTKAETYTAVITAKEWTLTVNSDNTSLGTVSGGKKCYDGETTTITATPANSFSSFVKWQKNGVDYAGGASINVTVNANDTYTAFFSGRNIIEVDIPNATYVDRNATYSLRGNSNGTSSESSGYYVDVQFNASTDALYSVDGIKHNGSNMSFTTKTIEGIEQPCGNRVITHLACYNATGDVYMFNIHWRFPWSGDTNDIFDGGTINTNMEVSYNSTYNAIEVYGYRRTEEWNGQYTYRMVDFLFVTGQRCSDEIKLPVGTYDINCTGEPGTVMSWQSGMGSDFSLCWSQNQGVDLGNKLLDHGTITVSKSGTTYTLVLNAYNSYDRALTATVSFNESIISGTIPNYTLNVTTDGHGTAKVYRYDCSGNENLVSNSGSYKQGSYFKLEATPASGYAFDYWTIDGVDEHFTNNPEILDGLYDNAVVTAHFKTAVMHTVTISTPTNGTITVMDGETTINNGDQVEEGTVLTVTATPATGYHFDSWANNGAASVTVNSDVTIGATFAVNTYTVTIAKNEDEWGTVSATSVANVPYGTVISNNGATVTINGTPVTATPAASNAQYSYAFSNWTNGTATVIGPTTVTANFTRTVNTYDITWKSEDGTSTLETDEAQAYGTTTAYNGATPTKMVTGYTYTFDGWATEANGTKAYNNGETPAVSGAATYYAHFTGERDNYTITYNGLEGASNSNPTSYNVESETIVLANPGARAGYTFAGWTDESDNTITQITTGSTGNRTLTATWNAATTLDLYDNQDATYYNNIKALNGQTYDVTYHRSVKYESDNGNARWYTLCLPFDVDQSQLTNAGLLRKVYEYRYATGSADEGDQVTFHFRVATSMVAGQGYLVKATGDMGPDFEFTSVTLDTDKDTESDVNDLKTNSANAYKESGDIAIVGVLRSGTLSNDDRKVMGLANNKIWYPHSSGNPMPAYRAYFYNPNASASVMPRVRIVVEGEGTTELEVVDGELISATEDSCAPSKYIRNGVLIIERNGVRYDAQGKRM